MLRWVRRSLTILSLLFCLASAFVWIRSYWVRDIISFGKAGGNCHLVQSILGRLHWMTHLDGGCSGGYDYRSDQLVSGAIWNGGMSSYPVQVERHLGFVWQTYSRTHIGFGPPLRTNHRLVVLPYWAPTLVFVLLPSLALIRRAYRRGKAGVCAKCGYDLRATPDRCPECGTIPVL